MDINPKMKTFLRIKDLRVGRRVFDIYAPHNLSDGDIASHIVRDTALSEKLSATYGIAYTVNVLSEHGSGEIKFLRKDNGHYCVINEIPK